MQGITGFPKLANGSAVKSIKTKWFLAFLSFIFLIFVTGCGGGGDSDSDGGGGGGGGGGCNMALIDHAPYNNLTAEGDGSYGTQSCVSTLNSNFIGSDNAVDNINDKVDSYNQAVAAGQCSLAEEYFGEATAIVDRLVNYQFPSTENNLQQCGFSTDEWMTYEDEFWSWLRTAGM